MFHLSPLLLKVRSSNLRGDICRPEAELATGAWTITGKVAVGHTALLTRFRRTLVHAYEVSNLGV